jgi:hypothetical protein
MHQGIPSIASSPMQETNETSTRPPHTDLSVSIPFLHALLEYCASSGACTSRHRRSGSVRLCLVKTRKHHRPCVDLGRQVGSSSGQDTCDFAALYCIGICAFSTFAASVSLIPLQHRSAREPNFSCDANSFPEVSASESLIISRKHTKETSQLRISKNKRILLMQAMMQLEQAKHLEQSAPVHTS